MTGIIDLQTVRHNEVMEEWKRLFNHCNASVAFAIGIEPGGKMKIVFMPGIPKDKIVFSLRAIADKIELEGTKPDMVL